MNIVSILDYLENLVSAAPAVPFSNKCSLDREQALNLLSDMRQTLPEEILEAETIRNEKNQILYDAQKESEAIISDAERQRTALIDQHEITQNAYQKADEIIQNAEAGAREIRMSANSYVEEILGEMEGYIQRYLDLVRQNRQQMKGR
ncbi:MAG: ATPase [Eubacteriales bacterium]|nr:ATPase [Eubacteriales bacterium]